MKKLSLALLLLLQSCSSYVPFTQKIRIDLESQKVDFTKIQFGIKDKILLKRSIIKNSNTVTNGVYKSESEIVREMVVFEKNTGNQVLEAACKESKDSKMALYFESGDLDLKRVVFRENEDGNYIFFEKDKQTKYDGFDYQIIEGQGTKLYISKVEINKKEAIKRKVSGLKVN